MGLFTVVHADAPCRNCRAIGHRRVQIRYGDMHLHEIRVGDPVPGSARKTDCHLYVPWVEDRFWVPGFAENPCPECGDEGDGASFAVVINDDVVEAVVPAAAGRAFRMTREVIPLEPGEWPDSGV